VPLPEHLIDHRGAEILKAKPTTYQNGMLEQWTVGLSTPPTARRTEHPVLFCLMLTSSDSGVGQAHVEFALRHGITSIIARKGSRPTKGRAVQAAQQEVMRVEIPNGGYKTAIRMFKEAFCIEI